MITGNRVSLRPWRRDDLSILRRWHDDGEVLRYWGERQPLVTEGAFERHVQPGERYTEFQGTGSFCICDENSWPIGHLQYDGGESRDRRAHLSVLIGERDARDKGYGTELVVLLLNWLFNQRNMHRAWLTVQADNHRAIHVYEKIGFVHEGTYRQHNFYDGAWHDERLYGIIANEFNARYRPDLSEWVVDGSIP